MNFIEIANYVWINSKEFCFGNANEWDNNLFTERANVKDQIKAKSGWYWFLLKITYNEMHKLVKPNTLPESGCNFGALTHINKKLFGGLIYQENNNDYLVIYNGHEKNIKSRIRIHYSLQNNNTGALGIVHYPLSTKEWKVKYFTEDEFTNDISEDDKKKICLLINSPTGRCSIESAWRTEYGWPILCKQ